MEDVRLQVSPLVDSDPGPSIYGIAVEQLDRSGQLEFRAALINAQIVMSDARSAGLRGIQATLGAGGKE